MNELAFHSQLLCKPRQLSPEMLRYLRLHPQKIALVHEIQDYNQAIEYALEVPVPEGLQARILLKQTKNT